MPILFTQFLDGESIYSCCSCAANIADNDELVSKAFQGRHGRAYLFSNVVNVTHGPVEERMLITGMHTVCDIQCSVCGSVLGWKYESAYEESQKYKVCIGTGWLAWFDRDGLIGMVGWHGLIGMV